MPFNLGDAVVFQNDVFNILEIRKGGKTNKPNMQSGIMNTGYKSKPKTYKLKDGLYVRGDKLKKVELK